MMAGMAAGGAPAANAAAAIFSGRNLAILLLKMGYKSLKKISGNLTFPLRRSE
jgi:hypothetical protein